MCDACYSDCPGSTVTHGSFAHVNLLKDGRAGGLRHWLAMACRSFVNLTRIVLCMSMRVGAPNFYSGV